MTITENATTQDHAVPPAPRPLSDNFDHDQWRRSPMHTGQPDPADPTDVVQLWGHCTDFCEETDDSRTDGLTVTEHGPWCRSAPVVYLGASDADTGRSLTLNAAVARPYFHGTYHRTAVWRRPTNRDKSVQLTIVDDNDGARVVNLSVGDALRLAAALTRACTVADGLDYDYNGGKARRAEGR